jgi:hypothetical protein
MFWQEAPDPSRPDGERKKKKKRRLLPPEPATIDPDRPGARPPPPAEILGGTPEEFTTWSPPSAMLNAYDPSPSFPHPSSDVDDDKAYVLEPDWAKPFNSASAPDWIKERMPKRDAETPLIASPWMENQPTLWQSVPDGLRTQFNLGGAKTGAEERADVLERRLNAMFGKLDDLEAGRIANNHMEILMFILGGIFLILLLDLIVKQGTQASVLLAAAGGRTLMSGAARGLLWAN